MCWILLVRHRFKNSKLCKECMSSPCLQQIWLKQLASATLKKDYFTQGCFHWADETTQIKLCTVCAAQGYYHHANYFIVIYLNAYINAISRNSETQSYDFTDFQKSPSSCLFITHQTKWLCCLLSFFATYTTLLWGLKPHSSLCSLYYFIQKLMRSTCGKSALFCAFTHMDFS